MIIAMKRDMDLIRAILLLVEVESSGYAPQNLEVEGYTQEEIGYHISLLGEAGLAVVHDVTDFGSKSPTGKIIRLTWAGHEFLDAARERTTWNQAKDAINKVGGATLQVWIAVLTAYVTKKLGI